MLLKYVLYNGVYVKYKFLITSISIFHRFTDINLSFAWLDRIEGRIDPSDTHLFSFTAEGNPCFVLSDIDIVCQN